MLVYFYVIVCMYSSIPVYQYITANQYTNTQPGADVDWILAGSGCSLSSSSAGGGHFLGASRGSAGLHASNAACLSASFTASDSFVNALAAYTHHPHASPTSSAR